MEDKSKSTCESNIVTSQIVYSIDQWTDGRLKLAQVLYKSSDNLDLTRISNRFQHHLDVTVRNRSRAEIGKFDEPPAVFHARKRQIEHSHEAWPTSTLFWRDATLPYTAGSAMYFLAADTLNRRSMCQILALSSHPLPHRPARERGNSSQGLLRLAAEGCPE